MRKELHYPHKIDIINSNELKKKRVFGSIGDSMAAKKYYAVKKGKITGVFKTWDECKAAVDGFPGAIYKGFSTLQEAQEFAGVRGMPVTEAGQTATTGTEEHSGNTTKAGAATKAATAARSRKKQTPMVSSANDIPQEGTLLAYVDGSYDDSLKKYAFGCVFLLADGRIYTEYGNGDNPQSLKHRNVTGEMLGAMFATKFALTNGFTQLELRYDYEGIEKWVTGAWRSKTELTGKYARAMQEWQKSIRIIFTKVAAHTNVRYNELADRMAKTGLTKGEGVPKVRLLADMVEYLEDNE